MPGDGTKNLIPFPQRTEEEQKRITTAGGVASGEARRKIRDFKNMMNIVLQEMVTRNGNTEQKITALEAICLKQAEKAINKGDTKAAKFCMEAITPKRIEVTGADGQPLNPALSVNLDLVKEMENHLDKQVDTDN